jgi:nucleoid DNA-binding protein
MSINKFDFIEYSATRYGIDFSTAETFVDMFISSLSELLNAGQSVEIDGIGKFENYPSSLAVLITRIILR